MKFTIDAQVIEVPGYPELLFVDKDSDISHKNLLSLLASYFKKEMHFDSLQFDESMYRNDDFTGFLFLKRDMDLVERIDHYPSRVIGGGVFENSHGNFTLDWVWIHPFERNSGTLKNRWKEFERKFGSFAVARPLSDHMSAFLAKHQSTASSRVV